MLPIAICGFVTKMVHQTMFKLVKLFCWVCSKNVDVKGFGSHEDRVYHSDESFGNAISNIFFDSQIHLISHLVEEVAIRGPISYR
jgi:hypothetical protein